MEKLNFVHFIDEELMPNGLRRDFFNDVDQNPFGEFPWKDWGKVIQNTIGLNWSHDNHSRVMKFGELSLTPTP